MTAPCEYCGRPAAAAPFGEINYSEALDASVCLDCYDRETPIRDPDGPEESG